MDTEARIGRTAADPADSRLDAKILPGPIEQKWDRHRFDMKLVSPANRRRHTILVVGSGLAGAAAAASLGELGYNVKCLSYHDSPRRAHSIAAQGGINAAKNSARAAAGEELRLLHRHQAAAGRGRRPGAAHFTLAGIDAQSDRGSRADGRAGGHHQLRQPG